METKDPVLAQQRWNHVQRLCADYEINLDDVPASIEDGDEVALIEENRLASQGYLTFHGSIEDALEYHEAQEYRDEWDIAAMVALATGDELDWREAQHDQVEVRLSRRELSGVMAMSHAVSLMAEHADDLSRDGELADHAVAMLHSAAVATGVTPTYEQVVGWLYAWGQADLAQYSDLPRPEGHADLNRQITEEARRID